MVPAPCKPTAPAPPPAYQRAVAKRGPALHIDALTLVTRLHLLALCRLAVQQAPRRYTEESLLRTLWHLSPRAMADWLRAWPVLALACGLPVRADGTPWVPSPSPQSASARARHSTPR